MSIQLWTLWGELHKRSIFSHLGRNTTLIIRASVVCALCLFSILTPSFLSLPSLASLLSTVSIIGCIAAGMTFITLSGNIMSFALGVTAAASAIVFTFILNIAGLAPALIGAVVFAAIITGLQGFAIGSYRANPIIISIAANILIGGIASWLTGNETVSAAPNAGHSLLKGTIEEVPIETIIVLALVGLGQIILSLTVFGRNLLLIGSSLATAEAVGLPITRTIVGGYAFAGMFAAVTGVLLAVRYDQGNMTFAVNYDYDAIAAVLVGGTPITGGHGSIIRTLVGAVAVAVIGDLLLLHGFDVVWRYLISGLVILLVIVLYSGRR